jgi:hypothetical protein
METARCLNVQMMILYMNAEIQQANQTIEEVLQDRKQIAYTVSVETDSFADRIIE